MAAQTLDREAFAGLPMAQSSLHPSQGFRSVHRWKQASMYHSHRLRSRGLVSKLAVRGGPRRGYKGGYRASSLLGQGDTYVRKLKNAA